MPTIPQKQKKQSASDWLTEKNVSFPDYSQAFDEFQAASSAHKDALEGTLKDLAKLKRDIALAKLQLVTPDEGMSKELKDKAQLDLKINLAKLQLATTDADEKTKAAARIILLDAYINLAKGKITALLDANHKLQVSSVKKVVNELKNHLTTNKLQDEVSIEDMFKNTFAKIERDIFKNKKSITLGNKKSLISIISNLFKQLINKKHQPQTTDEIKSDMALNLAKELDDIQTIIKSPNKSKKILISSSSVNANQKGR